MFALRRSNFLQSKFITLQKYNNFETYNTKNEKL